MTHRILLCLSVCLGLCVAAPVAMAQSRQHQRIIGHLNHPECQPNPQIFDGTNIVSPPAQFPAATKWFVAYNSRLKLAINAFKRLSTADRQHPATRQLQKQLYDRQQYGKAAYAALIRAERAYKKWHASNRKMDPGTTNPAARGSGTRVVSTDRSKAVCLHFGKEVIKEARFNDVGQRIMNQFKNGDIKLQSVKSMKEHRAVLDRIAKECAKPIANELPPVGHCDRYDRKLRRDPRTWCQAAAKADELMGGFARNYGAWLVKQRAAQFRPDQIGAEGWIPITTPLRYVDATTISDATRADLTKNVGPLLEAAGLPADQVLDAKLTAELNASKAQLKAVIDKVAPGLKTPRGGTHYSSGMASRRVKKRLGKGARVIKHVLKPGWTVKKKRMKNIRTGAIVMFPAYRYATGYVLSKVKGDALCQLRQFTVYEYTKGTRTFHRARDKDVTLGYVRFQKCR